MTTLNAYFRYDGYFGGDDVSGIIFNFGGLVGIFGLKSLLYRVGSRLQCNHQKSVAIMRNASAMSIVIVK